MIARKDGSKLLILLVIIFLSFTIVFAQYTIKPDSLPDAIIGLPYEVKLYVDPSSSIDVWEIAKGSLPPGLSLSKLDSIHGVISGTPSQEGTYYFTVKATKLSLLKPSLVVTKDYKITVTRTKLDLQPQTIAAATENSTYSQYLTVSGGIEPYTWTVTGLDTETTGIAWRLARSIPLGRTDSIELYGTPPIGSHGSRIITIAVRDKGGSSISRQYLLTINELPWTYEVSFRRLTGLLGDEYRAYVLLDELVFNSSRTHLEQPIYELTIRKTSGVGEKWFTVNTVNLPGRDQLYVGADLILNPGSGYVGETLSWLRYRHLSTLTFTGTYLRSGS